MPRRPQPIRDSNSRNLKSSPSLILDFILFLSLVIAPSQSSPCPLPTRIIQVHLRQSNDSAYLIPLSDQRSFRRRKATSIDPKDDSSIAILPSSFAAKQRHGRAEKLMKGSRLYMRKADLTAAFSRPFWHQSCSPVSPHMGAMSFPSLSV